MHERLLNVESGSMKLVNAVINDANKHSLVGSQVMIFNHETMCMSLQYRLHRCPTGGVHRSEEVRMCIPKVESSDDIVWETQFEYISFSYTVCTSMKFVGVGHLRVNS